MLEFNTIYLGDCLDLIKEVADESIDLVVTDPPYLMNYHTGRRKNKEHKFCKAIENDSNPLLISTILPELYRVMKPNTAMYMFCNQDKIGFFQEQINRYFKIKNMIVWVKNHWTSGDLKAQYGKKYEFIIYANKGRRLLNGKRIGDVWFYDRVMGKKLLHQNQKPVDLLEECIRRSSNPGELVLDPFAGLVSTAVACVNTDRKYICIEKDEYYYNLAIERINKKDA